MSVEADAADLVVHEGIVITEAAAKLAAMGAKNLAALVLALATESNNLTGKTALKNLVKEGREPVIFPLKEHELRAFKQEAKKYGFPFSTIKSKDSDVLEVIARRDDITKINRAMANIGYGEIAPEEPEKNVKSRVPSTKASTGRGSGSKSREPRTTIEQTDAPAPEKPSVVSKIEAVKKLMKAEISRQRDETAPSRS